MNLIPGNYYITRQGNLAKVQSINPEFGRFRVQVQVREITGRWETLLLDLDGKFMPNQQSRHDLIREATETDKNRFHAVP